MKRVKGGEDKATNVCFLYLALYIWHFVLPHLLLTNVLRTKDRCWGSESGGSARRWSKETDVLLSVFISMAWPLHMLELKPLESGFWLWRWGPPFHWKRLQWQTTSDISNHRQLGVFSRQYLKLSTYALHNDNNTSVMSLKLFSSVYIKGQHSQL